MNSQKKRFTDLRIKTKLAILIVIFLLSHVLISFVAGVLFRSLQTLNIVVNEQRVFIEHFNKGIQNFYEYEISENPAELQQAYDEFEKSYQIAYTFAHIDSLMKSMAHEEWVASFYRIFGEGVESESQIELMGSQIGFLSKVDKESLQDVRMTATNGYKLAARINGLIDIYIADPSPVNLAAIQMALTEIDPITRTFTLKMYELNDHVTKLLIIIMTVLVLLLLGFATFIAVVISKSIALPIAQLARNFENISKGNLKSSVKIDSKNEVGDLSRAFLEIQNGLQNIITHAKNVARGDYSNRLEPKSAEDELTVTLNKMTDKLQESKNRTDKQNWLQNGIDGLEDEMRGNFTVRELSDKIINYLCDFLKLELGAVYVYDEVLEHFELTGYTGINPAEVQQLIKPGEGLAGKAAKQKTLQILDTKEKYHKIYSASGELYPEKLYLLPMYYNNQIQAVIELAGIHQLSEEKVQFLNLTVERISVNLNVAVARFRNKELLDKTLDQAKVLEERDKELSMKLEENQRIQKDLVKEKALLDSMLKIIPDHIHFKDTECRFLRVSESMPDLIGVRNSGEIIGKTDFDFYDKKEARHYFEEEQRMIKTGEGVVDKINRNVGKDGTVTWTSVTKLPMYDETNSCIGTFSISKDITPIKQLEIELQKQNDKLLSNQNKLKSTIERMDKVQSELEREKTLMDSLLNTLPDAVYFKDLESRFIKVGKSMPKLFGKEKPEDLYGKTDFDFFEKEYAETAFKDEQRIIRTKEPIVGVVEKEMYKDGTVRYVSSTKMPLLNEKGEVIGTFGISRDITKIKELELEVKKRNDKLKAQQEELKATNEELKTQEEELRVANEELAEQTKILSESEKNLQMQQEELHVTNEELETKTNLLEQQKKEILEKNENLLKIQNELKQKAKELEKASRYKSEFLANMSHELRTPLNSLLILSKLLSGNKKGNLTDEQLQSVNIIYKSGKDLLELINEILDLSKIEAGKMKYEFEEIAVSEITAEIRQTFNPVAENKGLKLELRQAERFPEKIFTDKQRLMQIVKNLLSNAFKFTSEGKVTVHFDVPDSATLFINGNLNKDNTYFIAVEDSGVGIPRDKLEGIFEAFQQADGSISRKFGGTGLGLSISKQLTHVLGGEIHVESNEGDGSVFTVYLPSDRELIGIETKSELKDSQKSHKKKQQKKKDNRNSAKISANNQSEKVSLPFFIEDDRDEKFNRLLVLLIHNDKEKAKKLLEISHKRKFNAIVAASIKDGIALAEQYHPQAVIISAELSDSSELQNLKNSNATKQLPLHIVSRIEDSVMENIEELRTPETENFEDDSKNIESKISKEYKEVLVVEDDEITRKTIQMLFENKDIIIHEAQTAQEAFELISAKPFDSVILDLGLPDYSGKELLKKLKDNKIPIPNIIINTAKELSQKELRELHEYSDSIVIKGVKSDERLMDEVTLFLHQVEHTQPKTAPVLMDEEEIFKGKKVLVVDDDIRNIFALAQILEEREIEVMEAENGEVAVEVLKNNPDVDLVLMDIMMPVMNGYDAMQAIREIPELENLPIITLTAKAMKEDYQKAIDSGANDYISKPVDMDKLISLLKIWLFK